ncbi:DUF7856 family protein [Halorussus halobius]|uniref:DUF7856 family protein n=1 Tax=Halorussus halobius TaxID=1710537 RepID=UPI00109300A4|nr:hypothetical protein [Halorussus halobius]
MKVGVGDAVRTGHAVDLRAFVGIDLAPATVAEAVRDDGPRVVGDGGDRDCSLAVDCPAPEPVHDHVGRIDADLALARGPALAAAARSRGHVAPQAEELAAVRERLGALDPPTVDCERARERVAEAGDAEAEWRERVATLRGRVQALRERDVDSADAESDLAEATRRLSEIETERIAAEQALARARERARETRETRRERLRLEDRAGNLRRAARESLAERVRDEFEAARSAVPETGLPTGTRDALAVARVADLDAPIALAGEVDPFESAGAAARWLDAPVILV